LQWKLLLGHFFVCWVRENEGLVNPATPVDVEEMQTASDDAKPFMDKRRIIIIVSKTRNERNKIGRWEMGDVDVDVVENGDGTFVPPSSG